MSFTKTFTLQRAIVGRKRNRDGEVLASRINPESVGTSELALHDGSIEIIDVEQVKGKTI